MTDDSERKTGSDTYHISKLTEDNYRSWAQQLRWILDEKELLGIVEGTERAPSQGGGMSSEDYEASLASYNKRMKKARSTIGASVSTSVMTYIEGMDNPAEMWRELGDRYNPKSQATLLQVVREFMMARKEDSISMEHHLQRVQRLKRQVEEQGEKISDTIYNSVLLNGVPESYRIAVSILESQDNLTPNIIINRLLEESRKQYGSGNNDVKMALFSASARLDQKKDKKNLKCIGCGKTGHVDSDCWVKHPEKRPVKNGNKGKKKRDGETKFAMSAVSKGSGSRTEHWYLDSGASEHFSPHRHLFTDFKEMGNPCKITTAEGTAFGTGIGTIIIPVIASNTINILQLENVIYAPNMDSNLLSLTTLYDRGYEISMHPQHGINILKHGVLVSNTARDGKLFHLKTVAHQALKATTGESIGLWHKKMGHLGQEDVRKLEGMAEGIKLLKDTKMGACGPCLEGKQTRHPSHLPRKRATEPLELIHSDTGGQITPMSLGGSSAYVIFIDDATGMTFLEPIKNRTAKEMLRIFKSFRAMVENQLNRRIKRFRTDGGGEYEAALAGYLKEIGVLHETTAPYSPDQNGVSERANRTIMERTKAILADTKLDKVLWMEIAATVVYLKNRSPTTSLEGKTPYEAWFGRKPNLSHLRIVGTIAYIHIPKERRRKMDFHSHEGRLVGYGGTNQYRVWDPIRKDVITSRDVVFKEDVPAEADISTTNEEEEIHSDSEMVSITSDAEIPLNHDGYTEFQQPAIVSQQSGPERREIGLNPHPSLILSGPRRNRGQPPERYGDEDWIRGKRTAKLAQTLHEPQTFNDAINHPDHGKQWEQAIKDELNSLIKNKTWTVTNLPKGRNAISCKWVFKQKVNEMGEIVRFKARLVARGFSQVYGVDYLDTFAPVAKLSAIRILLAIATVEDLEIHQMDVVTAFLIPELEEEIYMEIPEGYLNAKDAGPSQILEGEKVCKLQKGLYGLKQSARLWNLRFRQHLMSLGFKQSVCDSCVYINEQTGIILAIWVDDLIVIGNDIALINKTKSDLKKEFEMKDLGELQYFLGIQVSRDRKNRRMHLNQSGYISSILERFGMQSSKPVSTPIATGTVLQKALSTDALVDQREYQSMVGSQMYSMLCTRPDTAFVVSQMSQHNASPTDLHSSTAKRAFRYLNATPTLGITYDGSRSNGKLKLEGYSDADFAASQSRRSMMGYIFKLGGGAVTWMSKLEPTVAISTTEAEYMALLQATKESIWIQRFLKELGREIDCSSVIFEDNQGAIALANNPEYHARTKHIDVQYHFVRECVEMGKIKLVYCPTEEMIADALTKPLSRDRFEKLVSRMGLESMNVFKKWE
jgi:hypothetical protein